MMLGYDFFCETGLEKSDIDLMVKMYKDLSDEKERLLIDGGYIDIQKMCDVLVFFHQFKSMGISYYQYMGKVEKTLN